MSDEKLRELERAFQESGTEEAELAWLREAARQGWISPSTLRLIDHAVPKLTAAEAYLLRRDPHADWIVRFCELPERFVMRGLLRVVEEVAPRLSWADNENPAYLPSLQSALRFARHASVSAAEPRPHDQPLVRLPSRSASDLAVSLALLPGFQAAEKNIVRLPELVVASVEGHDKESAQSCVLSGCRLAMVSDVLTVGAIQAWERAGAAVRETLRAPVLACARQALDLARRS